MSGFSDGQRGIAAVADHVRFTASHLPEIAVSFDGTGAFLGKEALHDVCKNAASRLLEPEGLSDTSCDFVSVDRTFDVDHFLCQSADLRDC